MYVDVQDDVQDYDTTALTYIKRKINIGQEILESELGSYWTEETLTRTSTANNGTYKVPVDIVKLTQAFVTVGTLKYDLEQVFNEDYWQYLKTSFYNQYGDSPTHIIIRRDTFEIFPALATAGSTITLRYQAGNKFMQFDDYTDGTITTLTNGDDDVTGSSTVWTTAMEGRYFKINADENWYKIYDVTANTTLVLNSTYQGLSIAAGTSAYTIGELPRTPGPTHYLPCVYAKWQYFNGFKQDTDRSLVYKREWEEGLVRAKSTYGKRYSSSYIPGRMGRNVYYNPNYPPRNLT